LMKMRRLASLFHTLMVVLFATGVASAFTHSVPPRSAANANSNKNNLVDLTNYHVTTDVQSRLLKTTIDMTFRRSRNANPTTCSSILHTMTLQLPLLARVQSLEMDLSDGCQLESQVQGLKQAKDSFESMASQGKPAALLTAWDMSNYQLQIVLPPPLPLQEEPSNATTNATTTTLQEESSTTKVRLTYTELLVQKNHKVSFQLPIFPGIPVSDLQIDLTVQDFSADVLELNFDEPLFNVTQVDSKRAIAQLEDTITNQDDLPRLVRGFFRPGSLPEAGVLTIPLQDSDEEEVCFTHFFNPSDFLATADSMPKHMVFALDISSSMHSESRLVNAKVAFASMVSALIDSRDAFAVQTFASQGTETLWGPSVATPTSKQEAIQFVQSLYPSGGTNLNDAYLDGVIQARSMTFNANAVPILILLSDGQASEGVADRASIARNVQEANYMGEVKIFSLAFGSSADVDLLTGIALQNGGKVLRIYEGYDDTIPQMENFYQQELKKILLSDIDISYFQKANGNVGATSVSTASLLPLSILDSTTSKFPVLAEGSELVIRGKVARSQLPTSNSILQASISALSAVGNQQWSHDYSLPDLDNGDNNAFDENPPLIINDCEQSFAHARIEELLNNRNAQRALGGAFTTTASTKASSFEEQARSIAIDAQLVWPGLTALVTIENPSCQPYLKAEQENGSTAQVC